LEKFLLLKNKIKKNEGYRNKPYLDSLGNPTIGYGHLITKKEKKIFQDKFSKKFLSNLFDKDFKKALTDYKKNFNYKKHSKEKKEVLIEMIFQLGIKKQKKFVKMNKHMQNNDMFLAALEMKNSLWYKQTPKRVDGLISLLLKKEYEKKR
tara:strand:- start:638 stop:1087 length:450 start_codon:yes stop_codon:yes gene_type:complete